MILPKKNERKKQRKKAPCMLVEITLYYANFQGEVKFLTGGRVRMKESI